MKKYIWINYDLGLKGDYEGLFIWLDRLGAKECGSNSALVIIEVDAAIKDIPSFVKSELERFVKINPERDRIYMQWLNTQDDNLKKASIKGKFLFGMRKRSPWEGYASGIDELEDIGS